jgi:phospholipid/cholesterol/gamma-HCH transport system substrate-binding protein
MSGYARTTPEEVQKAFRAIASIVIVIVFAVAATVAVRSAYGAFSDDMVVHTRFVRAGQALRPGSDVKYRGVNVGKVRKVTLNHRGVDVVLRIHKDARIPKSTSATVRPKTLFGEKYVQLAVRNGDAGPFLKDGDHVRAAGTGTEVEALLDTTDHLLRSVDATELATLMDELVKASQGEGARVARLIDKSVNATAVMSDTLDAQLHAIDSFKRFSAEYRDIGPSLNGINANLNDLLPTFNAARADYERLLTTLRPFADHLADFVEVNEANFDKILDDGDNIVRVLTARKQNISETIYGLSRYTYTLAEAIAPGTLPDGSRYGNLKLFIDVSDINALLCAVLGPSSQGADLSPVREALAAQVPQLACPGDGAAAATTPGGSGSSTTGASGGGAAPDPSTDITKALATPDTSTNGGSVGDMLLPLLGGAG